MAEPAPVALEPVEPGPPEPVDTPARKGPLARLVGGVGDLFARVRRKKTTAAPDQTMQLSADDILADQTMELASDDIVAVDAVTPPPIPRATKRRRT